MELWISEGISILFHETHKLLQLWLVSRYVSRLKSLSTCKLQSFCQIVSFHISNGPSPKFPKRWSLYFIPPSPCCILLAATYHGIIHSRLTNNKEVKRSMKHIQDAWASSDNKQWELGADVHKHHSSHWSSCKPKYWSGIAMGEGSPSWLEFNLL